MYQMEQQVSQSVQHAQLEHIIQGQRILHVLLVELDIIVQIVQREIHAQVVLQHQLINLLQEQNVTLQQLQVGGQKLLKHVE